MKNKNILISGAGIAGLTLAYWLKEFGFNPTVLEKAPKPREGGYMIDFFGVGVDVAEKMGLLKELSREDPDIKEITSVNRHNKRIGGLNVVKFKKVLHGRAFNLLRSSLAKVINEKVSGNIEMIFGCSIKGLENLPPKVTVTLTNGSVRDYDLVIGADGLRSNVRSLAFGEESRYERWYGYYTSSFTIENFLNDDKTFATYTIPGKQAAVFPQKDNKLSAFFVFRAKSKIQFKHHDAEQQKDILRATYGDMGWYCPELLKRMDATSDFYFDAVSQIKMSEWSKGRVSLVGDACDCPSLLSGQGSALAMTGAYILAGELKSAGGDYHKAFSRYQEIMLPFVSHKQKLAERFADSFVPRNKMDLWIRNTFTNLMFLPFVSKWFANQFLKDDLQLKDY